MTPVSVASLGEARGFWGRKARAAHESAAHAEPRPAPKDSKKRGWLRLKIRRYYTQAGQDPYQGITFEPRTSEIKNPDGSSVFKMDNVMVPSTWSQVATDILAQKYFRKAGVPQEHGTTAGETDSRQVFHRLAGCWRHWGEKYGYFDTTEDAAPSTTSWPHAGHQIAAPNSPQWFNTGLHLRLRDHRGPPGPLSTSIARLERAVQEPECLRASAAARLLHLSVKDDLVNEGGIMDLWTREARIFKYGSGAGTNFSKIRGGARSSPAAVSSSGLMSFLRSATAPPARSSRAAPPAAPPRWSCLDIDHPDIEEFITGRSARSKRSRRSSPAASSMRT